MKWVEDGQVKYAAVDTVELFQREKKIKEYEKQRKEKERRQVEEGF